MPTSQNGWSAASDLAIRPLVIGGVSFLPGIRDDDDVATVLGYVLTQFHERVEPLVNPGCWGFNYRENRNDPNSLSNHSSGTAVDANAPAHPNGVPTVNTFTPAQVSKVHAILAEVDNVIRWGGDYHGTPDAMHFEVNTDAATLYAVAERIRENADMNAAQDERLKTIETKVDVIGAALAKFVKDEGDRAAAEKQRDRASWKRDLKIIKEMVEQGADLDELVAYVDKHGQPD